MRGPFARSKHTLYPKVSAEEKIRAQAKERLSTVSTGEVLTWAEAAINGFHMNLDSYRSHREPGAFEELRKAVSMLSGAMDVLEHRNQS